MLIAAAALVLLGLFYIFGAERLRDWSVRVMQGKSYLTWVRVTGAMMVLVGTAVLIAIGMGLLDRPPFP